MEFEVELKVPIVHENITHSTRLEADKKLGKALLTSSEPEIANPLVNA